MKIVHLCLGAFFADNYSYQENMLPKFHKELGYDVEIIASQETFDSNGKITYLNQSGSYLNEWDIKVTRLNYSYPININHKLKHYQGVYEVLDIANPDIIFIHNCQFMSIHNVVRYLKKKTQVKVYVDNHVDFSNSAKNIFSKYFLHKCIWKYCAKLIEPFTTSFYGVLPARVDFLKSVYGIPEKKCKLLVMGADDQKVKEAKEDIIRYEKRVEYEIGDNDIVIMTGGKIDHNKTQTLLLMEAVNKLDLQNIKLLVFGTVIPELKDMFEERLSEKVKYIGWKVAGEIYKEYAVADLVAFPGLHSVLWEQAVGMGKPCIFRKIEGFSHIDLDGNCEYFTEDSIEAYSTVITRCLSKIKEMSSVAEKKGMLYFSYKNIAKKALEE